MRDVNAAAGVLACYLIAIVTPSLSVVPIVAETANGNHCPLLDLSDESLYDNLVAREPKQMKMITFGH